MEIKTNLKEELRELISSFKVASDILDKAVSEGAYYDGECHRLLEKIEVIKKEIEGDNYVSFDSIPPVKIL